jgi:hypothetical protein
MRSSTLAMPSLKSLALLLILSACKSASQPAPIAEAPAAGPSAPVKPDGDAAGESGGCAAAGKEWFTPAGDAEPTISKGCFTRCDTTGCPSGHECRTVTTNPCGETEDGQVRTCTQASTQTRLCLPAQ